MSSEIRALVALEDGVRPDRLELVLPEADGVKVLEYVDGLAPGRSALRESRADLVIVACSAGCEEAAALIEDAVKQRPDRPVVVLQLDEAESNGFMQQVFAAGADDIIGLPERPSPRERCSLR